MSSNSDVDVESGQDLSFFGKSSDFLDYCPFTLGLKPSELGLRKINENDSFENVDFKDRHFLIDENSYQLYLNSKKKMRHLHPDEDYKNHLNDKENLAVFRYMADRLAKEYPQKFTFFSNTLSTQAESCFFDGDIFRVESLDSNSNPEFEYRDAIDFLAHQIQEDFCLVDIETLKARLIHLASPNDWTAKWGIEKDFDEIHVRVPRAFQIVKRPPQIFKRLFQSGFLYERLGAMTLTSYPYLLRHPSHKETPISEEYLNFYFRFERQTLKAIPNSNLILFTIRPFLMDFTDRVQQELTLEQVEQMSSRELENRYSWFFEANKTYFKNLFS